MNDLQRQVRGSHPRVYVMLLGQDDPRKCTSAKLAKLRLATPLYKPRQIPPRSLVLNPVAPRMILPSDKRDVLAYGLVAIDCSWDKFQEVFAKNWPGSGRRLPTLLASNPVNYAKPHKLSSVEALAAGLYIVGFKESARGLLGPFKWGETFLTLNSQPLESYSSVKSEDELVRQESQFF